MCTVCLLKKIFIAFGIASLLGFWLVDRRLKKEAESVPDVTPRVFGATWLSGTRAVYFGLMAAIAIAALLHVPASDCPPGEHDYHRRMVVGMLAFSAIVLSLLTAMALRQFYAVVQIDAQGITIKSPGAENRCAWDELAELRVYSLGLKDGSTLKLPPLDQSRALLEAILSRLPKLSAADARQALDRPPGQARRFRTAEGIGLEGDELVLYRNIGAKRYPLEQLSAVGMDPAGIGRPRVMLHFKDGRHRLLTDEMGDPALLLRRLRAVIP